MDENDKEAVPAEVGGGIVHRRYHMVRTGQQFDSSRVFMDADTNALALQHMMELIPACPECGPSTVCFDWTVRWVEFMKGTMTGKYGLMAMFTAMLMRAGDRTITFDEAELDRAISEPSVVQTHQHMVSGQMAVTLVKASEYRADAEEDEPDEGIQEEEWPIM